MSSTATTSSRGSRIALWTVQILLALFMGIASGLPKLIGVDAAVETFDQMGVGDWFRYLVGALEVAGAIGLVIPRLAGLAAACLAALMVGAAYTQYFVLDGGLLVLTPLVLLVVFVAIAYAHRAGLRALVGRRPALTDGR